MKVDVLQELLARLRARVGNIEVIVSGAERDYDFSVSVGGGRDVGTDAIIIGIDDEEGEE